MNHYEGPHVFAWSLFKHYQYQPIGLVTIVVCGFLCPMRSFRREAFWDRLGGQSSGGSRGPLTKIFFSRPFGPPFGLKLRGRPPPPDPPLQSYPLSNTERAPSKVILDSEFHGMDSRFQVLGFVFFVSGTWISVSKAENLDRASTKIPVLFPASGIQIPLYWRTEPES